MSTFNQFFALSKKTTAILNKDNTTSTYLVAVPSYLQNTPILSGSLTANTLSTLYSHTGSGSINFLALFVNDATSRSIRIKLTLDGNVVYDELSSTITTAYNGLKPIGIWDNTNKILALEPIAYNESILVEISSTLTETDSLSAIINAYTTE